MKPLALVLLLGFAQAAPPTSTSPSISASPAPSNPTSGSDVTAAVASPLDRWQWNPRERTGRGLAAWKHEKPAEAVEALDTAARLRPDDPLAVYNSGTAHLGAGLADAVPILERVLRDMPADLAADAHYNLGNARLAAKDAAGAVEAYKEALRRAPGNAGARRNLELALRMLEEQKKQEQNQQQPSDQNDEGDPSQPPPQSQDGSEKPEQPSGAPQDDPERAPGSREPSDGRQGTSSERERPLPQFQDQQDMSAEQAAAILQAVENLERERRREEAKERAQTRTIVEKDW